MRYAWVDSPVGRLRVAADARGLREIRFVDAGAASLPRDAYDRQEQDVAVDATCAQLQEYFAGARRTFALPLVPQGTDFQLRVWQATRAIAYGSTANYGDVAERIGDAGAARAVGMALNVNPLPIVIPCHRVIGATGDLVGFGGGLERKRWLLRLEGALPQGELF